LVLRISPSYRFTIGAVLLILLSGCAAPDKPISFIEPEAAKKNYAALVLKGIQNSTGKELAQELLQRTANRLREKLIAMGARVVNERPSAASRDFLILDAKLVRYEGGDAFGRWIGFGAGRAVCSVFVDLIDGRSGKDVGDVISTQTIETGGLFSAGAENYIVDWCADGAADGIMRELRSAK
jgi:hypothetical protein